MKKLFVSMIALLLIISGTVNAQKKIKITPEAKAQTKTDTLKSTLSLNDDQIAKVYAIELDAFMQADSLRVANKGGDKTVMKGLMKPVNDARDAKIKAVLTIEQAGKFKGKKAALNRGGKKTSKAPVGQ